MSFAGGVFSRLYNFTADAAASIPAQPARFDNELAGIATGLSTCLLRDGSQTVIANIPMGGFKFTGLGAASATGQAITFDQIAASGGAALIGVAAGGTLQAALGGFISAASPAFTGTPLAPTATVGTNTTQIATTAFVIAAFAAGSPTYLLKAGGTMTGPIVTVASVVGAAGLNIPSGVAPTAPANGDVWTTATGFFARIAGVTQQLQAKPTARAWSSMTGSRADGTSYINSSGKEIGVSLTVYSNETAALGTGSVIVAGTTITTGLVGGPYTRNIYYQTYFEVPDSATYQVNIGSGGSIIGWAELR